MQRGEKGTDAPEQLPCEGPCYELSEFKDTHPGQWKTV